MQSGAEAEEQDGLLDPKPQVYKEYPYRYCILVLHGLFSMVVGSSYSGYSAIAPQVQIVTLSLSHSQLYGLSVTETNLISSAALTVSLVLVIPSTYILSYSPIRLSIYIIAISTLIGAWVRCLINVAFTYAVIGQYIFFISYAF